MNSLFYCVSEHKLSRVQKEMEEGINGLEKEILAMLKEVTL